MVKKKGTKKFTKKSVKTIKKKNKKGLREIVNILIFPIKFLVRGLIVIKNVFLGLLVFIGKQINTFDTFIEPVVVKYNKFILWIFHKIIIFYKLIFKPLFFLFSILKNLITKLAGKIAPLVKMLPGIFGIRFTFTKPEWLHYVQDKLSRFDKKTVFDKVRFYFSTVFFIALTTILLYLFLHDENVKLYSFQISQPSAMKLKDGAAPESLVISFSGSVAKLPDIKKQVRDGIFIKPKIKGVWYWESESRLTFTPEKDWPIGEEYDVSFDESFFAHHVELKQYSQSFKSPQFHVYVEKFKFYIDPKKPGLKKAIATVRFSHPVDKEKFEKVVKIYFGDKKLNTTISYDKFSGKAYIHSELLTMPEQTTDLSLFIDDGIGSSLGGPGLKDTITVTETVASKYDMYKISAVDVSTVRNEFHEIEQVVVIDNTFKIKQKDLLKNVRAYLLPEDRPEVNGLSKVSNYQWDDVAVIDNKILQLSQPVTLSGIPTEHDYATLHSFKYDAEVDRYMYIKIKKGTRAYGDFLLNKDYETIVQVPSIPREVRILHDGSLLSLSGDKKITMMAYDVKSVRVEIGRVLPDQINHLISQTSGSFQNPRFNSRSISKDSIAESYSNTIKLADRGHGKRQYFSFDFSRYLKSERGRLKNGLFFFRVKVCDSDKDCNERISETSNDYGDEEYYGDDNEEEELVVDERFVLVTDLGILVKKAYDKSQDVFVQSIFSGQPVENARVDVIGANGLSIATRYTNNSGRAIFPLLTNYKREKKPIAYVIKKGNDLSFMPYRRNDRNLNFSRYNVGGLYGYSDTDRLLAYLFTDRGIYRPGDESHLGIIVKSANWKKQLAGIPVEAVVTDARSLEVFNKKFKLSAIGFESIDFKIDPTSPTGVYNVSLYIPNKNGTRSLLGSTSFKVEEFLPDTMKITTRFSKLVSRGWVSPDINGRVMVHNLYGTPAQNRKITGEITLQPAKFYFREYSDYHFFDPFQAEKSFSEALPIKYSDNRGETEMYFNLDRFEKASYRLTFRAEGFVSEGGRAVSSESVVLVSPLDYLIGYKTNSNLTYLYKGASAPVHIIAIDPQLNKRAVKKISVQLYEIRYLSVLTKLEDGTYRYKSVRKENPISKKNIAISGSGRYYSLPTDRAGDFVLVLQNHDGTELNKINYTVVGQGNLTQQLEKNAELQLRLNKSDYLPGELIQLYIKAPYKGHGLITIEKDKVYTYKWFKTNTTSSIQTIQVPASLLGNGYVNVSFIRSLDSKEIYTSPISYAVAPFSVNQESRRNKITLQCIAKARPGDTFKMYYKTKFLGKITIYAVDEGILQVAGYRTPDPLSYFFKKRALEVKTSQIMDLILPEFSMVKRLSAFGGGDSGDIDDTIGKNLNLFKRKRHKPVVFWSGIVNSDSTLRKIEYRVPDYFNGTLRVMAVAVSQNGVSAVQKKSLIKGHFIITPNLPMFAAPGDEIEVSVGVSNNLKGAGKNAEINVALSTDMQVVGNHEQVVQIAENNEGVVKYRIKVNDMLGSRPLRFTATLGKFKTQISENISVRPPVPYITDVTSGYIKNDKIEIPVTRVMYPEYRKLKLTLSRLPLGLSKGLVQYLNDYPYGCTEQIVSQAFPALILKYRKGFGYDPEKMEKNITKAMHVLRARQNSEGAFGFWAANSYYSDFQSVYAMHFLVEAKERGYHIDSGLYKRGLAFLKNIAHGNGQSEMKLRNQAYAIYLLTRTGSVTTDYLLNIQSALDKEKNWEQDLIGVYLAASYKLLKQDSQADSIIDLIKIDANVAADYNNFYDYAVRNAQYIYIVAKHFPQKFNKINGDDLKHIVKPVIEGRFNTLSSAYIVLGLDAFAQSATKINRNKITIKEVLSGNKTAGIGIKDNLFPVMDFSDKARSVIVNNQESYNLFYQLTQAGLDVKPVTKDVKQNLEVYREYHDKDGRVLNSCDVGAKVYVKIKVRSFSTQQKNIAIVDLLPSGFEIDIEETRNKKTDNYDYVDIREDRIIFYAKARKDVAELEYVLRAANTGNFIVPAIFAESMYDRKIRAIAPGKRIEIVGENETKK